MLLMTNEPVETEPVEVAQDPVQLSEYTVVGRKRYPQKLTREQAAEILEMSVSGISYQRKKYENYRKKNKKNPPPGYGLPGSYNVVGRTRIDLKAVLAFKEMTESYDRDKRPWQTGGSYGYAG
jgi:hypothetical protein